nr:MAG TPA: hypothetical protein [Bacteriophage sp.]
MVIYQIPLDYSTYYVDLLIGDHFHHLCHRVCVNRTNVQSSLQEHLPWCMLSLIQAIIQPLRTLKHQYDRHEVCQVYLQLFPVSKITNQ